MTADIESTPISTAKRRPARRMIGVRGGRISRSLSEYSLQKSSQRSSPKVLAIRLKESSWPSSRPASRPCCPCFRNFSTNWILELRRLGDPLSSRDEPTQSHPYPPVGRKISTESGFDSCERSHEAASHDRARLHDPSALRSPQARPLLTAGVTSR